MPGPPSPLPPRRFFPPRGPRRRCGEAAPVGSSGAPSPAPPSLKPRPRRRFCGPWAPAGVPGPPSPFPPRRFAPRARRRFPGVPGPPSPCCAAGPPARPSHSPPPSTTPAAPRLGWGGDLAFFALGFPHRDLSKSTFCFFLPLEDHLHSRCGSTLTAHGTRADTPPTPRTLDCPYVSSRILPRFLSPEWS